MSEPDNECAKRGMDLEIIKKILQAHKDQMLMHAHTATCHKAISAVLDAYEARCTAPSDARQKYSKKDVDSAGGKG